MNGRTARLLRKTAAAMNTANPADVTSVKSVKRVWNNTPRTTRDVLRPAIAAIFVRNTEST